MSLKDLSVHIGADTSEFSKGIDTVNEGIQSTQETAETASKSLASQASSLASEYKKQGLNASEAFKKAWSEIERTSTQSSTSKSKSFFSGFNLFSQSAKSGFDSLNNSMSKTFDTMNALSSGIKSLAKSAFALVGIATGIAGVVKAFTAYTALESSVNRVNDIFAESSKYIQYFAQNTAKSLGMAESSVYEYASTFGNLFNNITSDSYENAKVTISMLQASAVVASKTGRTMEDVMERIRSGLLGNTEAIEDLGINVNVAMLEVTDAFSQIADGRSWEQLSFYEQQQIRTLAILEQASGSFGDEIQQGSAYSVSVLTGAVEDFMSTAGEFVNEVFQPIIKYLTTTVQTVTTVFQSLNTDALQPIVNTLHTVVQYAVTALKSLVNIIGIDVSFNENSSELPDSFSASANSSGEISDNMSDTEKSAKKLQKILTGFDELNILSSPDSSSSDSDATSGTGSGQSVFSSLPDLAFSDEPALSVDIDTTKLEKNLAKVHNKLKPLTDSFSNLWDSLKPFANTIGEGLKWFWDNVLVPLGSWTIEKAVPTFLNSLSDTIDGVTSAWETASPVIKEELWDEFLQPIASFVADATIKTIRGIGKGIKFLGESITENQVRVLISLGKAVGAVALACKGYSVVSSMTTAIKNLVKTKIVPWFTSVFNTLGSTATLSLKTAFAGIGAFLAGWQIGSLLYDIWGKEIDSALHPIFDFFVNLWDNIKNLFSDWLSFWEEIGENMFDGIENGNWEPLLVSVDEKMRDIFGNKWSDFWEDVGNNMYAGIKGGNWEPLLTASDNVIRKLFGDRWKNFWQEKGERIYDGFHTGSTKGEKVLNSLDGITRVIFGDGWSDFWQGVGEKIQSGFQTAWNKITSIFGGAGAWFGGIWSNIQSAFGSVATWFRDTFSEAWQNVKNVFSTGGEVFSGITTGILDSFKEVVNMLIDGINEVITIPFNGINTALESIRDVRIMGATPFGWLSTIEVPQIPHLATGTVVPANYGEFLAVLGDNKRETEVVSPLSTIKRAVAEAMSQTNGTQGDIVINVSMFPNERTFQRYVVKAYHNEIARGGKL